MTKEIERRPLNDDDEPWTIHCIRCGKPMTLWYNGGELDQGECCELDYTLKSTGTELVITEFEKAPE